MRQHFCDADTPRRLPRSQEPTSDSQVSYLATTRSSRRPCPVVPAIYGKISSLVWTTLGDPCPASMPSVSIPFDQCMAAHRPRGQRDVTNIGQPRSSRSSI